MRSSTRATPLLLVLVALAAGGLVVGLLADHLRSDEEGDGFERAARGGGPGEALVGEGGVALDGSAAARPRPHAEPPAEDAAVKRAPAFPPSEGVAGRVVTARREPVAGAKVTLHLVPDVVAWGAADPPALAEAESEKDGGFLVGPAPPGRLKVRAVAPGFAPSVQAIPRRGTKVELVLDVGGALRVRVVDGEGAAVAEAGVLHTSSGWGAQVVTEARTGTDGTVRMESLPTGTGTLLVTKAGLGAARRNDVGIQPGGSTDVVLVLEGGRELVGTVTNAADKRPVVGAEIAVHYPWLPGLVPAPAVPSGEDGRYRTKVDVGVGEQFELRVKHPDFAEQRLWLNYNDGGSGSMTHDLALDQAVPGITGRVLGRDGGGVAGAQITYGGQQPGQTFPSATTGPDGRFDLASPAWGGPGSQWWIIALHPTEGVGSAHAQLPQRNDPRGKPVEIRLPGAGRIAGVVKDGAGEPVEGAAISVLPDWNALERSMRSGGRGMDWMLYQLLNDSRVAGSLSAVSDAQGAFAIASVPAATFQVTAQWGRLQATHETPLEVRPGQEARAELVLGEGQAIEGRVLDTEERPVVGATVWAQPTQARPGTTLTYPNGRSQSDGRFTLVNVGSATYQVYAQAAGFAQGQASNVAPGTRDVLVRMKSMGWVEGQVLADNVPYAGTFHVTAVRVGGAGPQRPERNMPQMDGGSSSQTFNDLEGRFVLQGLSGGEYRVGASTPDGRIVLGSPTVQVVEGRAAGPVTLLLLEGARLVGEVEGADGRPLLGAWIWAQPSADGDGQGPSAGARTDRTGAFQVRGLGAGSYRVQVTSDQGATWSELVDLAVGGERRVRLREQLPGNVRFTVVGADDAPLVKARPNLTDAAGNEIQANWQRLRREGIIDGRSQESWERATTTDASGQCLRRHVPPGRYRATAVLAGHEPVGEAVWIDVGAGAVTEVTVVLRRTP